MIPSLATTGKWTCVMEVEAEIFLYTLLIEFMWHMNVQAAGFGDQSNHMRLSRSPES
jgi:hypothetical protein